MDDFRVTLRLVRRLLTTCKENVSSGRLLRNIFDYLAHRTTWRVNKIYSDYQREEEIVALIRGLILLHVCNRHIFFKF